MRQDVRDGTVCASHPGARDLDSFRASSTTSMVATARNRVSGRGLTLVRHGRPSE
jgi:hypothetical protein